LLTESGINLKYSVETVSKNQYDFPVLRDGFDVGEQIPDNEPILKALPNYFCASRKDNARGMAVTISSYSDLDGIRRFHSTQAKVRVKKVTNVRAKQRAINKDI